jgi:hypothetical protein
MPDSMRNHKEQRARSRRWRGGGSSRGHLVAIPTMPGAAGGSFARNARIDLSQRAVGAKSVEPNFDPMEDKQCSRNHNSSDGDCY